MNIWGSFPKLTNFLYLDYWYLKDKKQITFRVVFHIGNTAAMPAINTNYIYGKK